LESELAREVHIAASARYWAILISCMALLLTEERSPAGKVAKER
jgi:hypothetical protein